MIYNTLGGWTDTDPEEVTEAELTQESMAYHEAGHAVVCLCLGLQFRAVTLGGTDGIQGSAADKVVACHAGTAAERLFVRRYYKSGAVKDLEDALFFIRALAGTEEAARILDQAAKEEAERLVMENEHAIRKVALGLLSKESRRLSYREVMEACTA